MEYSKDPEQLEKDIEELQFLLGQAKRDHSKTLLQNEIKTLQTTKTLLEQALPKKIEEVKINQNQENNSTQDMIKKESLIYQSISNYGWEQEGDIVKVYLTSGLDGIGKHLKNNIDCEFTDNSIDLRILDFNKKNLRLRVSPLNGIIDPARSKMKVKSNSIVLELKKGKSKYWDDIKDKKSKFGADSGLKKKGGLEDDENKDPSSSLMYMMKELYEQGDDQIKRTIAESWQKAQKDKLGGGV